MASVQVVYAYCVYIKTFVKILQEITQPGHFFILLKYLTEEQIFGEQLLCVVLYSIDFYFNVSGTPQTLNQVVTSHSEMKHVM